MLFEENDNLRRISEFIEEASAQGTSTLIHSVRGQSRACCAVVGYLMYRYQWSLFKALEYLNSRRPGAEIRASFFQQLEKLDAYLSIFQVRSASWNDAMINPDPSKSLEEAIVRNTYLNSKQEGEKLHLEQGSVPISSEVNTSRIRWADQDKEGGKVVEVIEGKAAGLRPVALKPSDSSCLKGRRKTPKQFKALVFTPEGPGYTSQIPENSAKDLFKPLQSDFSAEQFGLKAEVPKIESHMPSDLLFYMSPATEKEPAREERESGRSTASSTVADKPVKGTIFKSPFS